MSGGFSFPPPPPPPSKSATSTSSQDGAARQISLGAQSSRGRGNYGSGSRGRGQSFSRGNLVHQSSRPPGSSSSAWQNGESHVNSSRPTPNNDGPHALPHQPRLNHSNIGASPIGPQNGISHSRTLAGHKRKLDALKPPSEKPKKQGPPTAPSVPSFGASFVSPKPQSILNHSSTNQPHAGATSGRKSLGLTPTAHVSPAIESDDEADAPDEEAMYAELGSKLTFEHNGVVMSLKSQADLLAWKNERRKNWPTKTRVIERDDQRKRIGEERRRLLRITASVPRPRESQKPAAKQSDDPGLSGSPAQNPDERAEKLSELRKKVLDSEAKNRETKTQARQSEFGAAAPGAPPDAPNELPEESKLNPLVNLVTEYDSASEDDAAAEDAENNSSETSSESSLGSSSDAASDEDAPEVMTSRPSQARVEVDARPVCRVYANRGHCRYGDACNFRHERSATASTGIVVPQRDRKTAKQGSRSDDPNVTAKKGIFQRLKEQEQKEEDRMALQVIKYLGKAGFFNDEPPTNE